MLCIWYSYYLFVRLFFPARRSSLVKIEDPSWTISLVQPKAAQGRSLQAVNTAERIAKGITRRLLKCHLFTFKWIKSWKATQETAGEHPCPSPKAAGRSTMLSTGLAPQGWQRTGPEANATSPLPLTLRSSRACPRHNPPSACWSDGTKPFLPWVHRECRWTKKS